MFLSMIETQLGILPTAEFDGKTLSGNATISRYLAEEHGKLVKGNGLNIDKE